MKLLLVGNPNVGKSVIFSRLTGVKVIASNYPGTTVEFTEGFMSFSGVKAQVIDVPGTYSVQPTSKAEEVAIKLIDDADVIINVLDATNLERNLYLTLEIIRKTDKPLILVLNMWDEAKHKGIEIDINKLAQLLNIPVVATCGITGEGIKDLISKIPEAGRASLKESTDSIWIQIGRIISQIQKLHHRHHTFLDILEDLSIKPPASFFIAGSLVFLSFSLIRFIGENLINRILNPFFENIYNPLILKTSGILHEGSFWHTVFIGDLVNGKIEYGHSFGVLTTGVYVPFAIVFPYVLSFYLILGLLEDLGYLPRLAVLSDRLFHKLGVHGYAIIPMILGLGCNVPGALSSRLFEERREKFIVTTLMAIAVPCMAQTAMIMSLLGRFGGQYVFFVFFALLVLWFVLGNLLRIFTKGQSPEILIEIPPYRLPHITGVLKKLGMRISWFLKESVPLVLIGVFLINLFYSLKIVDFIGVAAAPIITKIWGLPRETIGALVVGFLRKDVAVGMLRPLDLSVRQAIVGAVVLSVYFPCAATFFVMLKELGIKDMLKSVAIMISVAIIFGGFLNFILYLWEVL